MWPAQSLSLPLLFRSVRCVKHALLPFSPPSSLLPTIHLYRTIPPSSSLSPVHLYYIQPLSRPSLPPSFLSLLYKTSLSSLPHVHLHYITLSLPSLPSSIMSIYTIYFYPSPSYTSLPLTLILLFYPYTFPSLISYLSLLLNSFHHHPSIPPVIFTWYSLHP